MKTLVAGENILASDLNDNFKFVRLSGDGSDGALAISSGTTTIDLGGQAVVTKNYTSISITGTGKLAFSNPHANGSIIYLLSQGDVTISSSQPAIDVKGLGGSAKTQGYGTFDTTSHIGADGNNASGSSSAGAGGAGGAILDTNSLDFFYTNNQAKLLKGVHLVCGTGGSNGGTGFSTNSGGAGGRGGGALFIGCAGSLDFTGTIDISGADGNDGTLDQGSGGGGGGGSGGAVGQLVILYSRLTAKTGTVTANGGTGGAGNGGQGNFAGGGGAGSAGHLSAGSAGGNGNTGGAGSAGTAGTNGCGGGGGGGCGSGNGGAGGAGGSSTSAYLICPF